MIRPSRLAALTTLVCAVLLGGCSSGGNRTAVSKHNDGPVRLAPDPAFAGARISVVFAERTVSHDSATFEWRKNGSPLYNVTANVLEPSEFVKGDRIAVTVHEGGRDLDAEIEVANTPPTVTRVTVFPATTGQPDLVATPEASDRDNDPLTYRFAWFRNGARVENETGATLSMSKLAIGDKVSVEVVASDGADESTPVQGDAVGLENRPPQFTSQPGLPGPKDDVFRYQAAANDPDRDVVHYELGSGPAGMAVSPEGEVIWPLPAKDQRAGDYAITIRAIDSRGGAATQQFTIRLSAPVAPAASK